MLALWVVEVITLALSSSWAALSSYCDLTIDKQHLTVLMSCSRKSVLMPRECELVPDSNMAPLSGCHLQAVFQGSPKLRCFRKHNVIAISVTSPINLFIIVIYRPPGPLGNFLDEMDTLLSAFPSDSTPLTALGDFKLPSDKFHSSGLLGLLN
ncbi:hypothetical protein QTP70_016242 [Hemibagrus guttatus]|uniref:Uncharacterized protein n=1 Tax=Hemibagrus guttatus TaxID=175788 RepID=A0AAE0UXC6_9TELE|nr:hypothetical protein QTP70_016242 [Hemibagrus guttatus]